MLVSIYASPGVLHAAPPSVGGEGVVGLVGEGGAVPAVQYSTVQYSTVVGWHSTGPAAACHRGCPGQARS